MVPKASLFFALVAGLSVPSIIALAGTAWLGPTFYPPMAHINQTGQTISSVIDIPFQHDLPCQINIRATIAGGETITNPDTGATLATSYKLTGNALATQDSNWIGSTDFLNHHYNVTTMGPTTDTLHLAVQIQSPTGHAVPAGTYTTHITLTAAWN